MAKFGFDLVTEKEIPELNTRARLYRDTRTGAQVLSMENRDENKVFGANFLTPPAVSNGIAHILEHSVLCGSRKYPVKEPFVELIKGSLHTFLNAMTYPDKTCYPCASQNLQDFYNLVDVYMDAVFNPLLTPQTLQQEGWHYELDASDQTMVFKGVVFNEMKGAYSSPDNMIREYSQQSLFPESIYGVDSGGDPKTIPDLTYEQFAAFYKTYYHPSNGLFWFYGDDDPDQRLKIVQDYIKNYQPITVDRTIAPQPRFSAPKRLTYRYDGDPAAQKRYITINWLLTENLDAETRFALAILDYILIGTPASPLRKALIDSGLGEDLTGAELEDGIRQIYFSTGLKGVAAENTDKVEPLILHTLEGLAHDGIDENMVEAALNTLEFRLREQNTGGFPRGLFMMINALGTWLYGGDPLAPLAFEAPLKAIREKVSGNGRYFENLIDRALLQNTHRTTVILQPDAALRSEEDAAERSRLDSVRAAMSDAEVQHVIQQTKALKVAQNTPDDPQHLATIPSLRRSDLPLKNKVTPRESIKDQDVQLVYHDLFTNGITYLDLGFDLHCLSQELLPFAPLFGDALLEMGTQEQDYVRLSQRIGQKTGGLRTSSHTSMVKNSDRSATWLFLRGKSTVAQTDELLHILQDVLLSTKFDNRERFRQIVLEAKATEETRLIPGGHQYAARRLRSHFDEAAWVADQIGGLEHLFFLRALAEKIDTDWPSVLAQLQVVHQALINRRALICNITLDADNWKTVRPKLSDFLAKLPVQDPQPAKWKPVYPDYNEGLAIPAQVNYVAKGANLYQLGYKYNGSLAVVTNYLRTTWLWERVRVQGGAYGGFNQFDQCSGVFNFVSYRDPNLLSTLDIYDQSSQFLRELRLDDETLTRAIIGAIGNIDAYQLPDAKGYSNLIQYLNGQTEEALQQMRDEVLSTTADQFHAFGELLGRMSDAGQIVVVGSQEAFEKANTLRPNLLRVKRVL